MVELYCRGKGIPIIRGNVPPQYSREIDAFIQMQIRGSRRNTKRKEEFDNMKIRNICLSVTEKFNSLCESPIEDYLYKALDNEELIQYFRMQFKIGTKIVDFACPIAFLVVECDGREYHFTEQRQIDKDQDMDKYLARKGWQVLHLKGTDIRINIALCISEIKRILNPFISNI